MTNSGVITFTPRELIHANSDLTSAVGKPQARPEQAAQGEEESSSSSWFSCAGPRSCAGDALVVLRSVPAVWGRYAPDTEAIRRSLDGRKWSGYESVVNAIVRPPRAYYNYGSMGPLSLSLHGMRYQRQDLVLVNDRNMR